MMKKSSIWLDNIKYKESEKLLNDSSFDVLIIGGGITGISIAYNLINSGLKVCLVEKNKIGHGVTSKTTGKITYLQELIYSNLKHTYDTKTAKLYLDSQMDAINIIKNIVDENNIDCNLEKVSSYVFTNDRKEIKKIKEEKKLLEKFKVKVYEGFKLKDNTSVKYCISVSDTYVFHPIKYLIKLKEILIKNRISIYENTKILSVEKKDTYISKTDTNTIKSKVVVFATHYPYFILPLMLPIKTYLEKSYLSAYKVDKNYKYSLITSSNPCVSTRYLDTGDNIYKMVLTDSHNIAFKNNDLKHFENLLDKLPSKPSFIWSNKDIISPDRLPYIGKISDNMYIATAYNTWGMTNSTIAGKIISDMILLRENKYSSLFDPKRSIKPIYKLPINVFSNTKSYISSKINKEKSWYKNVRFENINGNSVGIYKNGKKEYIVYNKCPHLKCSLIFNETEKTWDCPCHGSRFDIYGKCIEGPSNYDITYKDV